MPDMNCPNCNNTINENETICENCGWNANEADAEKKAPPKVVSGDKLTSEDLEAFSQGDAVLEFSAEQPASDLPVEKIKVKKSDKKHKSVKDIKEDVRNFIKNGIDHIDPSEMPVDSNIYSFQNIDTPDNQDGAGDMDGGAPPNAPGNENSVIDGLEDLFDGSDFPVVDADEEDEGKKSFLNKFTSLFIRLFLLIMTAAVAFLLGFFVSNFYNSNMYIDRTYNMAVKSVNAVLTKIPEGSDINLQQIYVKQGKEISECIIFCSINTSLGVYYNTNYRLVINEKDPEDTTLYYAFDPEKYEKLKNGTAEEAVTASVMMSHYDNFKRSMNEIAEGKNGWREANAAYINLIIHKK